jgi:hypothetical protein
MFFGHLQILKAHYCHAKITQPNGVCHPPLLDVIVVEQQSSFFVTTMQFNCNFAHSHVEVDG